ncbi:MAG: PKD domain-containing protein [Chitinophagales bacterium]
MKANFKHLIFFVFVFFFTTNSFSQKKIVPSIDLIGNRTGTDCDFSNTGFSYVINGNHVQLTSVQINNHYYEWQTDGGVFVGSRTIEYATPGTKNICLILRDTVLPSTFCDTTICHTFNLSIDSCPLSNVRFNATATQSQDTLKGTFSFSANGYTNYIINYGDGSPASTSLTHMYDSAGTYTACLTVSDTAFSGCTQTVCRIITFTNNDTTPHCHISNVLFDVVETLWNDTTLGIFTVSANGYTNYSIDYGDGSPISTNLSHLYGSAGTYNACLTVIDTAFSGCSQTLCRQIISITDTTPHCHISNVQFDATMTQSNDTLIATFNFSADGYTNYSIDYGDGSPISTDLTHRYDLADIYSACLIVIDTAFSGCAETVCKQIISTEDSTTLCDQITCMLPGDADHDLTVNNFDVLAIGLSYNRTGNIRPNATTEYILQPSPDWSTTHYYGYNDKFADCDGDGIIRAADATVISQNYIEEPQNIFNHGNNPDDSLPAVKLSFDTLPNAIVNGSCVGAQLVGDINVGNSTHTVDSAYGIAFSVNYPFDNDACFSVQIDVEPNSWFQTNNQVLLFYKNIPQYNRVDITIVRTDGEIRSGHGKIGQIKLITEGDVFGIHKGSGSILYDFYVTDVVAVNNIGKRIGMSGSETTVNFITLGTKQNKVNGLKFYPNLTNGKIYINAKETIESIKIIDTQGRIVYEASANKNDVQLDISNAENGMYILEVKGKNTISYEKIFKQ